MTTSTTEERTKNGNECETMTYTAFKAKEQKNKKNSEKICFHFVLVARNRPHRVSVCVSFSVCQWWCGVALAHCILSFFFQKIRDVSFEILKHSVARDLHLSNSVDEASNERQSRVVYVLS